MAFLDNLNGNYGFKLKVSGPISLHLGCDFEREEYGTLCIAPQQHIDHVVNHL